MAALAIYCRIVNRLLEEGYDPYTDNTERFHSAKNHGQTEDERPELCSKEEANDPPKENGMRFTAALDFDMNIKKKLLRDSSMRSYKSYLNVFWGWMGKNHPEVKYILHLDKKTVAEFLNDVLDRTSARNHNNYRASLSSMMGTLWNNEIVPSNFIWNIKKLRTDPKRNKTYSREEQERIFEYMEENDPLLLLFVQFVSYSFMRPIEVCHLKVGDLNLKDRVLSFKAKNSRLKTKIIPGILFELLPDLSKFKKTDSLFTPNGIGVLGIFPWTGRGSYFTKRYKKVVKDTFGLDEDYGIYSFRHFYITKLYRQMALETNPHTAKGELMTITGHTSMSALEKYLRDIDAELPKDYSGLLKN